MKGLIYIDWVEDIECGACGYSFSYDGDYLECVNSDCGEFEVKYKVPEEIFIDLEKA